MTEAARHSPSGYLACRGMDTTASAFGGVSHNYTLFTGGNFMKDSVEQCSIDVSLKYQRACALMLEKYLQDNGHNIYAADLLDALGAISHRLVYDITNICDLAYADELGCHDL